MIVTQLIVNHASTMEPHLMRTPDTEAPGAFLVGNPPRVLSGA